MPVRGMAPLVHYESLIQAAGLRREAGQAPFVFRLVPSPRDDFLQKFTTPDEKPTEHQTSLLQVLTLMNGRLMAQATSLERGGRCRPWPSRPSSTRPAGSRPCIWQRLSRRPRREELDRLVPYVESGGPAHDPRQALGDVFWALLE